MSTKGLSFEDLFMAFAIGVFAAGVLCLLGVLSFYPHPPKIIHYEVVKHEVPYFDTESGAKILASKLQTIEKATHVGLWADLKTPKGTYSLHIPIMLMIFFTYIGFSFRTGKRD